MAKFEKEVKNSSFGFGESNDAFAKYFTGKSWLNPLANKANVNVANVSLHQAVLITGMSTLFLKLWFVQLGKVGFKKKVSQLTR